MYQSWYGRHALLSLVLCIVLLSAASPPADADLSDDPLPPTATEDCEHQDSDWTKVKCAVTNIVGFAQKISKVYGGFKGSLDAAVFLGRILGILDGEVDLRHELTMLHEHLDRLGAALDKRMVSFQQLTHLGLSQQLVHTAAQQTALHMPFTQNTDGVNIAAGYVRTAMYDEFFQRYASGEAATDGESQGAWKRIIADRASVTSAGFVYDWRVGVPHLMQLIALRLALLPVLDPTFAHDQVFTSDLLDYRAALETQSSTMQAGVRCGVTYTDVTNHQEGPNEYRHTDIRVACADIYTGEAAIQTLQTFAWPYWSRNLTCTVTLKDGTKQSCAAAADAFWNNFRQTVLPPIKDTLREQVLLRLPLFEMRAMMDLLALYGTGNWDLTTQRQRIPVQEAPTLCLDTDGGSLAAGTNARLGTCDGSAAQQWTYDRARNTLTNVPSGLCLDVAWESADPGMGVGLWFCTGHVSQHWTYDPITHVVQNGLGTVLDIQWGTLAAGTPVWSYTPGGSAFWQALLAAIWTGGQVEVKPSPGWRADQPQPRRGGTLPPVQ